MVLKKLFLYGILLFSIGCGDDDGIDCELFDPAVPVIQLTYVDSERNNLIANGTLDADRIRVFNSEGFQIEFVIPLPSEFEVNPENNPSNYTVILFSPFSESETYTIELSDMVTDVLTVTFVLNSVTCGFSFFEATSATYNGLDVTIVPDGFGNTAIEIVLE